jgi:hypothetical protein
MLQSTQYALTTIAQANPVVQAERLRSQPKAKSIGLMQLIAASRRLRDPLERQLKSSGVGIWRTTEDGNKIFIDGAGEVRAGGPNGPILKEAPKKPEPKPKKPRAKKETKAEPAPAKPSDSDESKLTETGEKKKKPRKAREPKRKINDVIAEFIGTDDKETVESFKYFVDEAHSALGAQRNSDRESLREVLSAFGYTGSKASGWVGALRFKSDYDEIRGFDQMAEYAARYHPDLMAVETGEAFSGKDVEQAFFNRLQQGFPYAPGKDSDEVLKLAGEMAGPSFFGDAILTDEERKEQEYWDTVDF